MPIGGMIGGWKLALPNVVIEGQLGGVAALVNTR